MLFVPILYSGAIVIDNPEQLGIIHYPDPRLRRQAEPVQAFDEKLAAFVQRMFELMETGRGVGLAAPQVGVNLRLFVMNPTGEPDGLQVLINPDIHDMEGSIEAEEGCLSLPDVTAQIRRARRCRVTAQDLQGRPLELDAEDLLSRVVQHETDHLNGVLIIDRMGPSDRIATKKTLKSLEDVYKNGRGTRNGRRTART